MCGILGRVGFPIPLAVFERSLDLIAHRGPDAQGSFQHIDGRGQVLLGHRRLAIIDLSPGGAQPMHSQDGRYTIIFNGEIYNYVSLRKELEAEGVSLRSNSDTEVLLELYARRGTDVFARLNGMFALAILDRKSGAVIIARDHLGIKPLYFSSKGGAFTFSSEIKAMLGLGVAARLRHELLGEYLAQMWVQEPDTLFDGIYKLPAGTWGRLEEGEFQTHTFWDLQVSDIGVTMDSPLEQLEALINDAVKLQLVSDRPVGTYISGGVDSSIITQVAASLIPDMVAVSARMSKSDQQYEGMADDGVWADRFALLHPELHHRTLVMSPDLYDQYKALIWHLDEPIADPAIVPTFLLAQRAREAGAIVMLSGMGGDELFGGYSRYSAIQLLDLAEGFPRSAKEVALFAATGLTQMMGGPFKRKASHMQRFLQSSIDGWPISYASLIGHFRSEEIDGLVSPHWRANYSDKLERALTGYENQSSLRMAQRLDLKGFLASHNLIYSDKASMAASVEVRVPLLDYRLAEFAFSLPDTLRATRREEKVLLKQLCAKSVGREFAYRKKAGFAMPIRSWLRGETLRTELDAALSNGRVAHVLSKPELRQLLVDQDSGRQENSWKLWTLLNLELWMERFDVAV